MQPEKIRDRRGEPVVVVDDQGRSRIGTIEFGGPAAGAISIYCETGGRLIVRGNWDRIKSDPGGERPVWKSVCRD